MIVTTINVNGIRAAVKERSTDNLGLLAWLKETRADVVCLQETRADDAQIPDALTPAIADGWHLASAAPDVRAATELRCCRARRSMGSESVAAQTNSCRTAVTWRWTPQA